MNNFIEIERLTRDPFTGMCDRYINTIINMDKVIEVNVSKKRLDFGGYDSMVISEDSMKKILERIGMKDEIRNI